MTKDKDEKAVIRARMARTGESYAAARAQLARQIATPSDDPARADNLAMSVEARSAWNRAARTGGTAWDLVVALRFGRGIAARVLTQLGLQVVPWRSVEAESAVPAEMRDVISQVIRLVQAEGGSFDSGLLLRGAVATLDVGAVPTRWRKHVQAIQQADLGRLCAETAVVLGPEEFRTSGNGERGGGMFERFTDKARQVIVMSQQESRDFGHNWIGTEHLLLALLHGDGIAAQILASRGVTLEQMRPRVLAIVGPGTEPPGGHTPFTPRAKKVLELALREALELDHNYIGTEHLLLGLMREAEGVAAQLLAEDGITEADVRVEVLERLQGMTDDPA